MAKVLEFQVQYQSFQWQSGLIFLRIDCFDLQPRDWTHVSCLVGGFFTPEPPGNPYLYNTLSTCLVPQSCLTLCDPMECNPPGFSLHGDSPENTRVGCYALLQGIFPTQGLNPGLLHCRWTLYCLSHERSPYNTLNKVNFKKVHSLLLRFCES